MATANRFWHNLRRIAKHKYVPHIKKYATKFQTKKGPYIYIYIYMKKNKNKMAGNLHHQTRTNRRYTYE